MTQRNCSSLTHTPATLAAATPAPKNATPPSWYKPRIRVATTDDGAPRVYKRYPMPGATANAYFRLLATHEFSMLKQMDHFSFTPNSPCLNSANLTLSYSYLRGTPLKSWPRHTPLPAEFFRALIAASRQMHQHQLVHLDLGNAGNILVSPSRQPLIIDFGSALNTSRLPAVIRCWMMRKDTLGILKLWYKFSRDTMPSAHQEYFLRHYRKNIYTPKRLKKALKRLILRKLGVAGR